MYQKKLATPYHYTKTPPILRSRTASLGDVVPKTSCTTSQVSKRTYGRSHSIAASSTPGLLNRSQKAINKGSRKNSVSSIGSHISSLFSISSQVGLNIEDICFSSQNDGQVALNIGEKVAPKRNTLTANEVTDIILAKLRKSLNSKLAKYCTKPNIL